MHKHTVSLLHIICFEASNQRSDQLSELVACEGTRGIFSIDKDRLVLVIVIGTTESKGQKVRLDILVEKRVKCARGGSRVPVFHTWTEQSASTEGIAMDYEWKWKVRR